MFVVFSNFDAIKEYNRSEAYALSVALLGEGIAGRSGLVTPWPKNLVNLSPEDVRKLQEKAGAPKPPKKDAAKKDQA